MFNSARRVRRWTKASGIVELQYRRLQRVLRNTSQTLKTMENQCICTPFTSLSTNRRDDQVFPFFSASSNFRLAARIMSSLLFCSNACLSLLFADHACFCFLPLSGAESESGGVSGAWLIFEERLYRVIRSGWVDLGRAAVARAIGVEGMGGWKEMGG
jgi:hypothetical protein